METEQNDGPRHRADRPESVTTGKLDLPRVNPYAVCTGSRDGKHHVRPCPMHHPGTYARIAPRRWKHRQAVTA